MSSVYHTAPVEKSQAPSEHRPGEDTGGNDNNAAAGSSPNWCILVPYKYFSAQRLYKTANISIIATSVVWVWWPSFWLNQ